MILLINGCLACWPGLLRFLFVEGFEGIGVQNFELRFEIFSLTKNS